MRMWALVLLTVFAAGCRGFPEPIEVPETEGYQAIADRLPEVSLGVADAPAVVDLIKSDKIPPKSPPEELEVYANETSFFIRTNTLIPRRFAIPYEAIEDIDFVYSNFPNILFCVVFPFLQSWRTRLVIEAAYVPELMKTLREDIRILKGLSQQSGLPAPYYYAEELENRLARGEAEFGEGRLVLVISSTRPVPPFIPYAGDNRRIAELFRWARDRALATPGKGR